MQVKAHWRTVCLWLIASLLAALSCSLTRPAAHIGEEWFPIGHDSFYHAVRILQAAENPDAFYEFDPKIHAPEGSLLVWPWGYDYLIAKIVRVGVALGLSADPLTVMSWIPVCAVFLGIGLLMLVARRMQLGDWPTALAALAMALNQGTQILYGYGQIDHHYAEHICLLASLAAGLIWFQTQRRAAAVALGVILGGALAIHNALFVLQLPLLAAVAAMWLQGRQLELRSVYAFAAALVGSTLAVLLPSLPFLQMRFEFYTLSWFHLYVVSCTAIAMVLFTRVQPTRRGIAIVVATGVVLVLPLIEQIRYAESFVSGSLGMLGEIMEMRSPVHMALEGQVEMLSGLYSLLIWLSPVTLAFCALRAWRERQSPRLLFWVWCIFGLTLLSTQLRMHYFGSFALYVPWLILAQEQAEKWQEHAKRTLLITSLLLVIAYMPVIRHALVAPTPKAADQFFASLHPIFPALRKACEEDPGIVLADTNAGHYIRYFTRCSVMANNFLLTKQHFDKVSETRRLMSLSPQALVEQAPFVKYVLVRAGDIELKENGRYSYTFFGDATKLPEALLLAPRDSIPPEYESLFEVTMEVRREQTQNIPYANLYKILPHAGPAKASSEPLSGNGVSE